MKLITCRVPDETKAALETIAKRTDRPLGNLLRLIVVDFLSRYEKDPAVAAFVDTLNEK